MAVMGMSAGGILAGRAMTERPDLFAVAIPQVGVLNTLRFEFTPNGPNHIPEFGTIKNEDDFKNLYAMDSYAHIEDGVKYPATLVTGGLNDPRVILWQPGKFAARLQQATTSGKPVLFRIDMQGGHGGFSKAKDQTLHEQADIISFVLWQTNSQQNKKGMKAF
jgi:prolyl oligopeptidase